MKFFYKNGFIKPFYQFDKYKKKYIIHNMVVCSTAGGNNEQRAREGNDGRVD